MTRYHDQFTDIVNFIDANLDGELDVERLCKLACLSKYHFHRQFSSHFGMPVISLARLLRLKRAAYQLAYRDDAKIVDIAMANGYESHEAFSRAFKKHFNKTPFQFRRSPDWTPWHSKYEPVIKLRTMIMNENSDFKVKLIDFPETLLAVMEHRGAPNLLGKTIQKFIAWRKISHLPPNKSKTFNLIYDDPAVTGPENFRFDVCCSVDNGVEPNDFGIVSKTIPKGRCAVVRHIGSDESIGVVVNFLYSKWLLDSDFEVRDFPIFFERVSFFPEVPENEMITDIYLPID
ncbi:helix-turn-helix domain-containing protein [Alteromonas sediminis]|uniref:Helix-turn-helix domain-containing protein n=1 Tax=Alteromonas sediminis TaxID=2259342 RepID=A0A3N5Y671_9ALTE|nr:AraC family transcriptional regulator [Alteromonas sediminis]RPJ65879.1 helix-turn-helix domain-containing protein [Alteromonas sediminis]